MTRSSASIRTSEPSYKAPVSQWQRERASGLIQPMEAPCASSERWWISLALWVAIWGSTAVLWAVVA